MIITLHAAQRFLERVMKKNEYTTDELMFAKNYLAKVFKDFIPNSFAKTFALPGFENQFYVIHKANSIVTIIAKNQEN